MAVHSRLYSGGRRLWRWLVILDDWQHRCGSRNHWLLVLFFEQFRKFDLVQFEQQFLFEFWKLNLEFGKLDLVQFKQQLIFKFRRLIVLVERFVQLGHLSYQSRRGELQHAAGRRRDLLRHI